MFRLCLLIFVSSERTRFLLPNTVFVFVFVCPPRLIKIQVSVSFVDADSVGFVNSGLWLPHNMILLNCHQD
jgi:hypothetical protein